MRRSDSGNMAVGSVILAIVRGLVPMAKALAAIDILSNGRLFIWPIKDEIEQLRIFKHKVAPLVDP
jgi:hypothetical protein